MQFDCFLAYENDEGAKISQKTNKSKSNKQASLKSTNIDAEKIELFYLDGSDLFAVRCAYQQA
ncbi:hypothetical protein N9E78_00190 [bacterium]|nr:hypothetical protein [bacterium]